MPSAGYLDIAAIAPRIQGTRGADRGFIGGRSGSGKSYLARTLLTSYGAKSEKEFRGSKFLIDPNHNFEFESDEIWHRPSEVEIEPKKIKTYLYRPLPAFREAEDWNEIFRKLFYTDNKLITYIDETLALETLFTQRRVPGGNYFTAYLTQGRARGKAALMAAQRPVQIPRNVIGQAEWYYIFDLPLEDDRKYIAGTIGRYSDEGQDIADRKSLKRFEFWFKGPDTPDPMKLQVVK